MILIINYIILSICVLRSCSFEVNGKKYTIEHIHGGGEDYKIVIYRKGEPSKWLARGVYKKTYLKTGWDVLDIESNAEMEELEQAFMAGYLEGVATQEAIYDHYYNTNPTEISDKVQQEIQELLDTNHKWVSDMIVQHAASDIYWRQVQLFYLQMQGITEGYNSVATSDLKLSDTDIMWMNFESDINSLESAIEKETNNGLKGKEHCSALIKLIKGNSDILVSHTTWTSYNAMRRMIKRYTLPYKNVRTTSVSFSGYPGKLVSADDFFILSSGLVAQETTITNNNASLWPLIQPTGQVLEAVRVAVANKLADGGQSWTKIFSQFNSGTYNNQWMIVDMNKFTPGSVKPGLLWVAEQMPGFVRREDKTDVLTGQGYWASYNVPYYPDVFQQMGYPPLVKQFGDIFSFENAPRAQIFKRDQGKVVDLNSMMLLMRSNDYQHDPLSRCNCTPPYSAENAIASRCDLNPINGTYPLNLLSHRPRGATDAKVTSYELSKTLSMLAVSGPTTGTDLPPFQWSKSDFNEKVRHRGQPDLFNFQPVLVSWAE